MRIICHTNLDLERCEVWPKDLPIVPRIGDLIESAFGWKRCDSKGWAYPIVHLELEVVRVAWRYTTTDKFRTWDWEPRIELHLPKGRFESLTTFYEWYGKITGKGKAAYI